MSFVSRLRDMKPLVLRADGQTFSFTAKPNNEPRAQSRHGPGDDRPQGARASARETAGYVPIVIRFWRPLTLTITNQDFRPEVETLTPKHWSTVSHASMRLGPVAFRCSTSLGESFFLMGQMMTMRRDSVPVWQVEAESPWIITSRQALACKTETVGRIWQGQ